MPLNIIASQFFLPLSSVKLARFITSIESPVQGYHDPIYARTPEPTISSRQSYFGLNHDGNNTSFGFALTSLMSAAFSRRVKTRVKVMADCVRTYSLDNCDEWFTEAVAKSGTKTWIERAVDRGYNIYMVVGFHTVTNARIAHEVVQDKNAGGQVKVPVGLTLAAVGAIAPLGDIIDPSVGGNKQSVNNSQASFWRRENISVRFSTARSGIDGFPVIISIHHVSLSRTGGHLWRGAGTRKMAKMTLSK